MSKKQVETKDNLTLFMEAMQQASEKYGYRIAAQVQAEELGAVIQVRAQVVVVPIENGQAKIT